MRRRDGVTTGRRLATAGRYFCIKARSAMAKLGGRRGGLVYGSYRWNKLNIPRRTNKMNEMGPLRLFLCAADAL